MSRQITSYNLPVDPLLRVRQGQLTFDAEGSEQGPYFSRRAHAPPGSASGVTVGRGYDLGRRSQSEVVRDLVSAGMELSDARRLSEGAGLKGDRARTFVISRRVSLPVISRRVQKELFERVLYPRYEARAQRWLAAGGIDRAWITIDPRIREVLIDLAFRGDTTPRVRSHLRAAIEHNHVDAFVDRLTDEDFWKPGTPGHVPVDRFRRRGAFIRVTH
jgi:hypothetical protein